MFVINMFLKSIRVVFFILCFILFEQNVNAQIITYTFVDPCTKEVTLFSIPVQSGKTTIIFYGKVGYFDANDVSNGTFANWINKSYSDFRKISPCSQQQGQVTQNQITTQIISNTVQSIVSSIMSSAQSQSVNTETSNSSGNNDAGGKGNNNSSNKKKNNGSNNTNGTSTGSSSNQNGGESQSSSGTSNSDGGTNNSQGSGSSTNGGGSTNSGNSTQGGGSTTQPPVGSGSGTSGSSGNNGGSSGSGSTGGSGSGTSGSSGNNGGSGSGSGSGSTGGSGSGSGSSGNSGNNGGSSGSGSTGTSGNGSTTSGNSGNNGGSGTTPGTNTNTQKSEEVGTTITMNNDAHNDNGSGGGGSKSGKSGGNARSNPIIVSSDITSAQNLNKSYTPIVNIGTSRSSMTGLSSYGVTGMVWLNFEQFALSARYTKIHFNKSKKLKFVHNLNLTGVYTYGNFLGFVGYSGILNGGKYGITGFNVSAAATIIAMDKSGYYSPSITAFYTRPIKVNKKLIISPEIYIISTPLVYSTKEKVAVSDRYFSGFVGSGVDYQISKRFKVNVNYKANLSTNPQFPILSFFLIGSKVNL
jgi:hypothetical protein